MSPTTTNHLASLAAALNTGDREALAQTFAELAEEAIVRCDEAPNREAWQFWLDLHESCHYAALALREPPKPKRRWFR